MSDRPGLFAQIREDWIAHGRDWTRPGFRAVAIQRFGVWRMTVSPKLLRAPLSILYRMMFRRVRNNYGIELPYSVSLGRRVIVEHQGGIVVHGNTVIGDDCIIRQNCTLGLRRLDALDDAPILGNRVDLGAGSVVLGKVRLGDGAKVGANAVVLTDVPPGALAIGVPARIRVAGQANKGEAI
ncbi:serine acetyltransferase [Sphingomonas sp.]|uniref:serine O-acetyltransferase n=1 Tax=Sphingomonas sp. TaxID=28214 RepID=UPI000DB12034|nr:serine acetyltransferase [Sphingomonas sp.]PZU07486.1 MAG: serine acetyltransferase [Sphingomonas sp.]